MHLPSLAILPDFPEERWPSMDLVAEMLLKQLAASKQLRATRVCPPFHHRLGWFTSRGRNVDRLLNRMWYYPRFAKTLRGQFDCFHLCDHSYSQVVHALPADRTGVFCHDLDTFRCLLEPRKDPRPRWFRAMASRILKGLQKAKLVFYLTAEIRRQIEQHQLFDPARLVCAPPAAAEEFTCRPVTDLEAQAVSALVGARPFFLHVGSCIPRKRIDLLIDTFARTRSRTARTVEPIGLRDGLTDRGTTPAQEGTPVLVQVGGEFTGAQRDQIQRSGVADQIIQLRGLDRSTLAQLYRNALIVLQPSEAEGFGLPVVEALACGATVVASDIPVLREVGGDAVHYCPVGDVDAWSSAVVSLLGGELIPPPLEARLAQAARFSWAAHAIIIASAYIERVLA